MKKTTIFIIISLFIVSSSFAKLKFSAAPEISLLSGDTEYELDINYSYIDTTVTPFVGVNARLTSLLEFPMDVAVGGITFQFGPEEDFDKWNVQGGLFTSLTDPGGKMFDSDWQGETPYYDYTKWSYTESDAEMSMTQLELDITFRLTQKEKLTLSALLGGRYQKIKHDVIGLSGWQRPFNSSTNSFGAPVEFSNIYDGVKVGYYEVTYKHFKFGLLSEYRFSPRLTALLKTAFSPLLFDDYDDHILRNKESTADGDGNSFIGDLQFRYDITDSDNGRNLFIDVGASFLTLKATGPQTQFWYDDETHIEINNPLDPNDDVVVIDVPAGTTISGVPHTVRSTQTKINFRIGMHF